MARREDVETSIWDDDDFDALSDDAALLYLWSFTNPRCGMSGVYRVKSRSICEGRMTPARRTAALEELAEANFVHYVDGFIWVRSRVKHLRTKGPNMATSVVRDIERVPESHWVRGAFLAEYLEGSWVSERLAQADLANPSDTLEDPSHTLGTPSEGVQGMGKGKEVTTTAEDQKRAELRADWDDWLGHFKVTTGKTETTGSAEAKRFFAARRKAYSVEQLKLATVGAHSDPHMVERGYDRPETILRESKVDRYIALGKQRNANNGRRTDPALARITGRAA